MLVNIGDQDVRGSTNTYAVAGSGHARNDILGNVFHPVDLHMVESGGSYRILVSTTLIINTHSTLHSDYSRAKS